MAMFADGTVWQASLPREKRRGQGVYHTPPGLVDAVLAEVLPRFVARVGLGRDGAPRGRILDPAAGDGRFLLACRERLADLAAAAGHDRARAARAIGERCLVAVERDPEVAEVARRFLPDVRVGCALTSSVADGAWDLVVGNPPYVRSVTLKTADPALWSTLRGTLAATSYGEWDLYGAFLERAVGWGAEVGFVVPSRWLTAAFAAPLRAFLAERGAVRKIVHLGETQLFPGATTYVCLAFLGGKHDGVEVVRDGRTERWTGLGAAPWGAGHQGATLGDVARISKGAGTNADPVFLLERRGSGWHSRALDRTVELEAEVVVPCLRGRDIGPGRDAGMGALLPYDGDRALAPAVLAERYPRAWRYLLACRDRLEARERGRFRGERFFHWGRPQNLSWLRDAAPKVVVPDAGLGGRVLVDEARRLVIDTAYALRPTDPAFDCARLAAILGHTATTAWLRQNGLVLRGGYVRMKTAYLAALPLLDPD
jgi:Eco57I restriction-modification methylase